MKTLSCLIILVSASILSYPVAVYSEDISNPAVRVSIIENRDAIKLELKGRYKIYAIDSDKVVMEGPFLSAKVSGSINGLDIGGHEISHASVTVKTARDANIYIDGRRFRGDIDIMNESGGIRVINRIALDAYLYGVLYHEVSHRWPMEALKSQAIAARTFAFYQIKQNASQPYDLRSDIYSQVYGGRTSEKWSTNHAVDVTKGKVLTYKGDIFPAYYHATCAGHTEDAANLWNIDLPVLKGVPCVFCAGSKHFKWTKTITLRDIEKRLLGAGYKIGKIASFSVISKNRSGRADKIEIKDEAGTSVILNGKDFRQLIGPNELRSTKFDASIAGDNLVMNGFGWGHGVGMCQWGAFGMSRTGKNSSEILKYYYPGAEITDIKNIKKSAIH